MTIWQFLSLLLAGAFFGMLIIALFYWRLVRPRLLAQAEVTRAVEPASDGLQSSVKALNEAIIKHSALVSRLPTSFEVRQIDGDDKAVMDPAVLDAFWKSQASLAEELIALRDDLTTSQAALEDLYRLAKAANDGTANINATLIQQGDSLKALERRWISSEELVAGLQDGLQQLLATQQEQRNLLDMVSRQMLTSGRVIRRRKVTIEYTLEDIKGIGPVYANMLQEHGVASLGELAQLSPEELRALIDAPRWRSIDAEGWIEQARLLAETRQNAETEEES